MKRLVFRIAALTVVVSALVVVVIQAETRLNKVDIQKHAPKLLNCKKRSDDTTQITDIIQRLIRAYYHWETITG
jgi:hypothetical protein